MLTRSPVLLQAVRSPAFLFFPVLSAAALMACLRDPSAWVGDWSLTTMNIRTAIAGLAPLITALGVWTGRAEARHGLGPLLAATPLPTWRRLAVRLGVTAGWAVTAYAVGAAGALAHTSGSATWGSPPLALLAGTFLGTLVWAALGFLIGTLWNSVFAVPAAAVACYAVDFLAGWYYDSSWHQLVPLGGLLFDEVTAYRPAALYGQAAWLTGVLVLCLLGIATAGRAVPRVPGLVALGVCVLPVAACALFVTRAGSLVEREPARMADLECRRTGTAAQPTVCLHPARRGARQVTEAAVTDLSRALRGVKAIPTLFVQDAADDIPGEAATFSYASRRPARDDLVRQLATQLTMPACAYAGSTDGKGSTTALVADLWLVQTATGRRVEAGPELNRAVAALGALPAEDRAEHLSTVVGRARSCGAPAARP
ncbi:hypothetical protein ACH4U6_01545 [Streptomyces netropsis]|uniref:hypothetical protein n=1 Tax=Streptomyces netropsis TaxID=55404 RepID=UPI0037B7F674